MNPSLFLLLMLLCNTIWAEGQGPYGQTQQQQPVEAPPQEITNFEAEGALIDMQDALKSKQFVHRAILSTAIKDSGNIELSRFYINHLMGFNAIIQKGDGHLVQWAKYVSGAQGLSMGYAFSSGLAFEAGAEFSSVSSFYGGGRWFIQPRGFSLWPFLGAGLGKELASLSISQGPLEAQIYQGSRNLMYGVVGLLVPLLDVGLKVELRLSLYGKDRMVITQGIGVIVFL